MTGSHRMSKARRAKPMEGSPNTVEPNPPLHICGRTCLGPLAFHTGAMGTQLTLSQGDRRAERSKGTFQNGLGFSARTVRVGERVRLRVERTDQHWEGALRLGFTIVPPSRSAVPPVAIPDLTNMPGYWVEPVPAALAQLGSELRFWVDSHGSAYFKRFDGEQQLLLEGVDVNKALWAVIDVYGQTREVLLLGSKMKMGAMTVRRSCPIPRPADVTPGDSCLCVSKGRPCQSRRISASRQHTPPFATDETETTPPAANDISAVRTHSSSHLGEDCSVCLSENACVVLPCGHRCLCEPCATRVNEVFATCPLCRWPIM